MPRFATVRRVCLERASLVIVAVLTLQACSASAPPSALPHTERSADAQAASSTPTPAIGSRQSDPPASVGSADSYTVDASGRRLTMRCWGTGDPTVFFESGGGGLDELENSSLVGAIAARTRACLYNRAGLAPSDPAPNRRREAEDVAADFRALVREAGISAPYVLFGRSFGGMIVTFYAATHPSEVAGVVVFDSPAPSATMTRQDFPEGVWDAPGNVEHLNVLTGFENRFGKKPVRFPAPLIVINTTAGEAPPEDRYWLQTSPGARQVTLQGGMEVIDVQADAIATEILSLVEGAAHASPSPA